MLNFIVLLNPGVALAVLECSVEAPAAIRSAMKVTLRGEDDVPRELKLDKNGAFRSELTAGHYQAVFLSKGNSLIFKGMYLADGRNPMKVFWPTTFDGKKRNNQLAIAWDRGQAGLTNGEYANAEKAFMDALRVDCTQASIWGSLAMAQVGDGRQKQAVENFEMAIRLAPKEATYQNNLGSALYALGEFGRASGHHEWAASLDEKSRGLYLSNAGAALIAAGKTDRAIDAYSRATKSQACPPASFFHLGSLLYKSGRPEEAKTPLTEYLRLEPNGEFAANARRMIGGVASVGR